MKLKFSGLLKTVIIIVVGVATPCSLLSVLQLLEETCCLFSKVFIDLYEQYNIFIWSPNKYSQTQKLFCIYFENCVENTKGYFLHKFCIFVGIIMNRGSACLLNVIWDLLVIQNNFDLFLLLPHSSRTPLFLTHFSRQFLHCSAVWTLKFAERDTSYTKAAS